MNKQADDNSRREFEKETGFKLAGYIQMPDRWFEYAKWLESKLQEQKQKYASREKDIITMIEEYDMYELLEEMDTEFEAMKSPMKIKQELLKSIKANKEQ